MGDADTVTRTTTARMNSMTTIPESRPATSPFGGMSPYLFGVLIFAIVCIDFAVTWEFPGADPPLGYSQDRSLSVDGHWYMAEARSWVDGSDPAVGKGYRRPLISYPAYLFYRIGGVNSVTSRALSSTASLLCLLVLALLLNRRYGPHYAVLGTLILALQPGWHAFVRSPVIYPWVALWLLVILACNNSRHWRGLAFGGGLLALGLYGLKPILILAAPALLVEGLLQGRRWMVTRTAAGNEISKRTIAVGLSLLVAMVTIPVLAFVDLDGELGKLRQYLGEGSIWSRMGALEERSRFFSVLPVMLPLSWLGLLIFVSHAAPVRRAPRSLDRAMHITLWSGLLFFSVLSYSPLRYMIILLPVAVYLGTGAIHSLANADRLRPLPMGGFRSLSFVALAVAGTLYLFQEVVSGVRMSPLPMTAASVGFAGGVVLLGAVHRRRPHRLLAVALPLLAFVGVPGLYAVRLLPMIETPEQSMRHAGEEIARILLPNSRLIGPYAHALTVDNHISAGHLQTMAPGHYKEALQRLGATHLVAYADDDTPRNEYWFENEGVPLELIETFYVRGEKVLLYRIGGLGERPRSAYEEAVAAAGMGDPDAAAEHLRQVLTADLDSAAAWSALGFLHQRKGELQPAYFCYTSAIESDPYRVAAHISLAQLYMGRGFKREALEHLQAVLRACPSNEDIRSDVKRLKAEVDGGP